jgi:putative NIF3 family GTP cyclohydrolase 1 type 2
MKLENIITYLEDLAPIPIQERYDNSGLILGNKDSDISKVLVCLDADEKALDHAIEQHCQLVLSHHPVIFGGIKSFAGGSPEGDIVILIYFATGLA